MLRARIRAEPRTALRCPFLRTSAAEDSIAYPRGLQCGLRGGRRRAPSADEVTWFCTNGCHRSCPTYRQAQRPRGRLAQAS